MQQPSLFDPPPAEPKERNLDGLRRWLENELYVFRRADTMPWQELRLSFVTKDFMYYSGALPEAERDDYRAQFAEQMRRLKPTPAEIPSNP